MAISIPFVKRSNTYTLCYAERDRERMAREKRLTHFVNTAAIAKHIALIESGTVRALFENNLSKKELKYKVNAEMLERTDRIYEIIKEVDLDIYDKIDNEEECKHYDLIIEKCYSRVSQSLVDIYTTLHIVFKPFFNNCETDADFSATVIASQLTSIRIMLVMAKTFIEQALIATDGKYIHAAENLHQKEVNEVFEIVDDMQKYWTKRVKLDLNKCSNLSVVTKRLTQIFTADEPDLYHIVKQEIKKVK